MCFVSCLCLPRNCGGGVGKDPLPPRRVIGVRSGGVGPIRQDPSGQPTHSTFCRFDEWVYSTYKAATFVYINSAFRDVAGILT